MSGTSALASAPARLELSGRGTSSRLSVALDRRAVCRAETGVAGVVIESKDGLVATTGRDVAELVARERVPLAVHLLALVGAETGLRVVSESKLGPESGLDGDSALSLAIAAAVTRVLGRDPGPDELVRLALEAAARAGACDPHGHHAALWGGAVVTRATRDRLEALPLAADPGRIEEALLLVDLGAAHGATAAEAAARTPGPAVMAAPGVTERVVAALGCGGFEDAVALLAEEWAQWQAREPGPPERLDLKLVEAVRRAGGAALPIGERRLVAVFAPPGPRGPGRREAVREAVKAAGLRLVPLRVDLRGLEVD